MSWNSNEYARQQYSHHRHILSLLKQSHTTNDKLPLQGDASPPSRTLSPTVLVSPTSTQMQPIHNNGYQSSSIIGYNSYPSNPSSASHQGSDSTDTSISTPPSIIDKIDNIYTNPYHHIGHAAPTALLGTGSSGYDNNLDTSGLVNAGGLYGHGHLYDASPTGDSTWPIGSQNLDMTDYQTKVAPGGLTAHIPQPPYTSIFPSLLGVMPPFDLRGVYGTTGYHSSLPTPPAINGVDLSNGIPRIPPYPGDSDIIVDRVDSPVNYPASPLRCVSPDQSAITSTSCDDTGSRERRSSSCTTFKSDPPKKRAKRKVTWTAGPDEGPNVTQDQKRREIMELEELTKGGAGMQKEKRKIQNRFAQRAFRARSKVSNRMAATHVTTLEETSGRQEEELRLLRLKIVEKDAEIARLRLENTTLKASRWTQATE